MKVRELVMALMDYDPDSEVKVNVGLEILDIDSIGFDGHSDITDIFVEEEK